MYDLQEKMIPRLERLERQMAEMQMRFNQPPAIEIEIEAAGTDELIKDLQKLYQNFAAGCNLKIKVKMNAGAREGAA